MISRLRIEGFQALASFQVDFGKLTVITGPSNAGKSAVVRAFRVLATNPRGDWYVRDGSTATVVTVLLGEKSLIFARRKQVAYRVGAKDFTSVGVGVPDEVAAELNLDPLLQLPDQFDPPYLISLSPAKAADELGALTRADLVGKAVGVARNRSAERERESRLVSKQVEDAYARLESEFGWYAEAATLAREAKPLRDQAAALATGVTAGRTLAVRLSALSALLAPHVAAEVVQLAELADALVAKLDWAGSAAGLLRNLERMIAHAEALEADRTHFNLEQELADVLLDIDGIRRELSECPFCGQSLDTDAKEHLIEHATG